MREFVCVYKRVWERNGPSCQLSLFHFSLPFFHHRSNARVFSRQRTAVLLSVATLSTIIIIIRKVSTTATTCFLSTRTFCFSVLSDVTRLCVCAFNSYSCGAGIDDKKYMKICVWKQFLVYSKSFVLFWKELWKKV